MDQVIEPAELELPSGDGTIVGDARCSGLLVKPDDLTVYFEGRIEGRIARECVRCLAQFEEDLTLPCLVLFKKTSAGKALELGGRHGRSQDEEQNDGDDIYSIEGNQVDLLPVIREHIILSTPLQALCTEQCLGLCQGCGASLNAEKCSCPTPNPVPASEGVFHPDLSKVDKHSSGRSSGSRRKGSMRK